MGNKASSFNKMTLDTSTSINVMSQTLSSNRSSTSQSASGLQVFTISLKGATIRGSKFGVSQTIQMDQSIFTNITAQLASNLQSNLKQTLDAAVDQASKSKTDFGAFGSSSASNTVSAIKSALNASVQDIVKQENITQQIQSIVNTQLMTIDASQVTIIDSNIQLSQEMIIKQICKNIIDSVISKANTTLATGENKVQLQQKSEAATSGIGDMWANLMGFFNNATGVGGNLGIGLSSCVSCIICIVLIALVAILLSPAGQNAIGTGTNVLAARAGGGFR